jgi:uncharacterized protein YjiS (DUF1127 family)
MEFKMRDYILSQAQSRQDFGLVATAKRVVRNWKHHRELAGLLKLDDYLLRDMGLTRAIVLHLLSLPLTVDVDWEQERVLRMR